MPRWFKIILSIFAAIILFIALLLIFSKDVTDTVSDQLKSIRENRITEAYYNYASKAFQEATSLDQFRNFVEAFPSLSHNKSVLFVDRNVEGNQGTLDAILTSQEGIDSKASYHFIKEGDKWKILGITIQDQSESNQPLSQEQGSEEFNPQPLYAVIQDQIKSIVKGDLTHAYHQYTSESFQKATSYKEFVAFLKNQKGFSKNKKVDFGHLTFDNNIAQILVYLVSNEMRSRVEYHLIFEDDNWKIAHIRVISAEKVI